MKLTKIFAFFAIAGAMALAAINASATDFPVIPLTITGTAIIDTSFPTNNGKVTKLSSVQLKINSALLIQVLSNSASVKTTLADLGLPTIIPANSFFVWSPGRYAWDGNAYRNYLTITNKNGFSFNLVGLDTNTVSYYDYGFIDINQLQLLAQSFIQTNATKAGVEKDITGDEFYFNDGYNYFDCYGNATLTWTFGKTNSSSLQNTVLSVNLSAPDSYRGSIGGNAAMTSGLTITGKGTAQVQSSVFPFYLWW